ncbi:hypothetical protein KC19_11G079100 [Ceratodon purpureus]|uniref:Uncharacterized protein n=1 Tax=Ceratodon purpureus TaxID=3225 RepID=A0A8T0GBN2_CERPU|nr:hypothetical protein KC19_11G079100 [Ceratodon purpureus]
MSNRGGDDQVPAHDTGKQILGDVAPKHPSRSYSKSQLAVDRFGAVNVLAADKFGALRSLEGSRTNIYNNAEECSTGSSSPGEYNFLSPKHSQIAHKRPFGDDSIRSTYPDVLETQGTRSDPSSHSSIPISCTLHERQTPTRSDAGPPVKRYCPPPTAKHHNAHETHVGPYILSQNELVDLRRAEHNDSERGVSARSLPTTKSWCSDVDPTTTTLPTARFNIDRNSTLASAAMDSGSSESARHPDDSNDRNRVRFNYKFASAGLEASLLERMEARQRLQDVTNEPERCSHVISPEDLVWGSVKHYIGMVLDRETNCLLGTAVLFMPPEPRQRSQAAALKSAWVTSVQAVKGRTEVLIKNCRGVIHVAQLMLTSTALGLAFFSVNVWQGTFALAFLSRVSGPASLPHRLSVDVERTDRVYVIGYEEPWESESATIADARVRPGRIVDAGRHTIVEIDFTTGQLGGSIDSPAGFRGGLVVRADGLLAGVVTGELLNSHRTNIDLSSAHNIYALLEEL